MRRYSIIDRGFVTPFIEAKIAALKSGRSVLDQIGMRAYEDQCTPANPRIPLINDMKDIAVGAYYGVSQAEGHKLRIEREGEAATEEASER
jgi:acetaldehyde dehydrogenase/alcohol dehydrogenase